MNALQIIIDEVACARRDPAMQGAERMNVERDMEQWYQVARAARIALAALRKIRRVGSNVGGTRSEESEIAQAALKRMEAP